MGANSQSVIQMIRLTIFLLVTIAPLFVLAQNIGINETGANPHNSAILDVSSTSKGMLVPRMTTAQRNDIAAPANGLLVFDSNTSSFWFYNGGAWVELVSGTIDGNTLGEAYDQGGPGAGRIITADAGSVSVQGTDGFEVTGTFNSGNNIGNPGAGTRMFFNPRKAAFRAGRAVGNEWNQANVGNYSTATGNGNTASGVSSFAAGALNNVSGDFAVGLGTGNLVSGEGAVAIGESNSSTNSGSFVSGQNSSATSFGSIALGESCIASGDYAIAMGNQSSANGSSAVALGKDAQANGQNSTAFGNATIANGFSSSAFGGAVADAQYAFALGRFNEGGGSSGSWVPTDPLFEIGNGETASNKSNAVTVLKNGNTGLGTSSPTSTLHVDGSVRIQNGSQAAGRILTSDANGNATWTDAPPAGGTLDDAYDFGGAGTGRVIIADAGVVSVQGTDGVEVTGTYNSGETIGNPGGGTRMLFNPRKAAFRAGRVTSNQWNDANVGGYSASFGYENMASALYAMAFGFNTAATGNGSTAWGNATEATAEYATAWGQGTEASGLRATALGWNTVSWGQQSMTWGQNTDAGGTSATAWGSGSAAEAIQSTAWGLNTLASGLRATASGWNSTATGQQSMAWGQNNNSSATNTTAWGSGTNATGIQSTSWGQTTTASGLRSTAWGWDNAASGAQSTAFGVQNTAPSFVETVLGRFSTNYTPSSSTAWNSNDRLFVIGNGTSNTNRSNAVTVLKNGNVGMGTDAPQATVHIEGSLRYEDGQEAEGRVLVSDNDGNAVWTESVGFSCIRTTPVTLAAGNAIVFNFAFHNRGSAYNLTTGEFTAPVEGLYQFHYIEHNSAAANANTGITVRKNSNFYKQLHTIQVVSSTRYANTITWAMELDVGDVVTIELLGVSRSISGSAGGSAIKSSLEGFLVR